MQTYAIRLKPGADLKKRSAVLSKRKIAAGWIATCAGSLTQYHIRFANQSAGNQGMAISRSLDSPGQYPKTALICIFGGRWHRALYRWAPVRW